MPFLSVIIPVYNAEKYLPECFESIKKQNEQDYEVIIVDDGSNDSSPEICDTYADCDKRVNVFHIENGGPSRARNIGFVKAQGKYIFCVDNDDIIDSENFFSEIKNKLEDSDVDILMTGAKYIHENENAPFKSLEFSCIQDTEGLTSSQIVHKLISQKQYETSCWTKVIKKDFLIENEFFFDEGLLVEDLDWNMRMLQKARLDVLHSAGYVHVYRSGSITALKDKKYKSAIDQLTTIKRWYSFYDSYKNDDVLREALLSYLCYQFFITMGMTAVMDKQQREVIKKELKDIDGITKFAIERKQKLLAIMYRSLGYSVTYAFVGKYFVTLRKIARLRRK